MMIGIDVSHWQGLVDWPKAKAAGAEFAYIKATDGMYGVDDKLAENLQACILPHGCYHFFRPELDAAKQADLFIANVPKQTLPPAVDVEINSASVSMNTFRNALQSFLASLEAHYGEIPVIYTRKYFWEPNLGKTGWASRYPLWVAHYTTAADPLMPSDWTKWTIWQYSANGNRRGAEFGAQSADIDIDRAVDGFVTPAPPPTGGVDRAKVLAAIALLQEAVA